MPRRAKGPYLYLKPEQFDKRSGKTEPAAWVIRDGKAIRRTGCAADQHPQALERWLAYCAEKHEIDRTPKRRADQISLADVLTIYSNDVAAGHTRPKETGARLLALSVFWGSKMLSEVSGQSCRAYIKSRPSAASARRELEDLRSAINHHRKEGLCTELISVVLPPKSESRDRWLTRSEAARLIWAAYRYREVQKGHPTGRRSRRHIARFILVGLYTGTRAGAICSAAFQAGPGQGFLDLDRGVFYRRPQGAKITKKRQTPVRLPDRLIAHLRRWHSRPEPPLTPKAKSGPPRMISEKFAVEFNGQPIGKVNKAFKSVVTAAGLGFDVIPHTLRHTAATWMMQAGVDLHEAAGFLGMTAETLEDVYGHHHPDFQEAAAAGVSQRSSRSTTAQLRRKQT